MAEIITRGRLPEDEWYEHTCSNCVTRFKFRRKELQACSGSSLTIGCPFCSKVCYLSSTSLKRYSASQPYGGGWGPYDR